MGSGDVYKRQKQDLTKKSTRVKNQIKGLLKYYGIRYPEEFDDSRCHWSKKFIGWLGSIKFETSYGKQCMESYLRELEFIKSEILTINRQLIKAQKEGFYKQEVEILKSIPGIGNVSVTTIMSELIDINRFIKRDNYLSYLGLAPTEHSSGDKRKIGHLLSLIHISEPTRPY